MSVEALDRGPVAYAQHLAGYIKDASRVEALTKMEFGTAPPRADIASFIASKHRPHKPVWDNKTIARRSDATDGEHFQVRGLVKRRETAPAPQPVEGRDERPFVLPEIPADLLPSEKVLYGVAQDFLMSPEDITGSKRHPRYVNARVVVVRILRERNPLLWSYVKIGQFLGGRDHSTVINLLNNWDIYVRRCPLVAESYERRREP